MSSSKPGMIKMVGIVHLGAKFLSVFGSVNRKKQLSAPMIHGETGYWQLHSKIEKMEKKIEVINEGRKRPFYIYTRVPMHKQLRLIIHAYVQPTLYAQPF